MNFWKMRDGKLKVLISFLSDFFDKTFFIIILKSLNLVNFFLFVKFKYKVSCVYVTNRLYSIYSFSFFVNLETRSML